MRPHSIIFIVSLIIATACLGAGYALAGYRLAAAAALVLGLLWLVVGKEPLFWMASSFLLAYILLAAIGIIANTPPLLMVLACAAALACWDLKRFNQGIPGNSPHKADLALEKHHLYSLALAISAGLIVAFIGNYINLQLPFGVIIFLVLITVLGLTYSTQQYLKKQR